MKKVAIVGYGGQGGWHARHISASDVVMLSGVYDIKPERNDFARSCGYRAFGSYDEMLSSDADIIVIATPNDSHYDLCKRAFAAGKNVICEKPAEMTLEAVNDMIGFAENAGKLFAVHHNRRWDVDYLAMKSIIESHDIGAPIRIESRIHGSRGIPSDWRGKKEFGGGMIFDWGVHLIDQILLLIPDDIKSVYCQTTNITNKEVDDGFRLNIDFVTGKSAYVEVGTFNFIAMPRFYMTAERGTAIIDNWKVNARVVKCKYWHENDVLPVQTAAGITKTMAPRDSVTVDEYTVEKPVADVHDFYRNVCAAIDGREELTVTYSQVRKNIKVMLAAFESAETGLPVKFN